MIRYQITNGKYSLNPDAWMRTLCDDIDFVQIREHNLAARDLAELTRKVILRGGAKVLVNDRIDVAIACGAAGVHLRSRSISPKQVKALHPMIVTVACHEVDDFAQVDGADYAVLAPVFAPLSKQSAGRPLGLETLRVCAGISPVPVIALGGITSDNCGACMAAGATGVAGITLYGEKKRGRLSSARRY